MRVKNFNDPVSMADGTLKTLVGMGGDSGGGSGAAPVAGLTLEEFNSDDLPKNLMHDGILIIAHDDIESSIQIIVEVTGVKHHFNFNTTKNTVFVCPVKDGSLIRQINSDPRHNNTFFYYH